MSADLIAQWERMQTQTFTRWVNSHLMKRGMKVESILSDLRDGRNLINLLEIISDEQFKTYNKNPKLKIHSIENLNRALKFIQEHDVKLASIGAEEIEEGNVKLTLGLIWTVILRFAIVGLSEEGLSAKEGLLLWCRRKTEPYKNVNVKDFTMSFQDGLAFCALIHRHRPDLIDYDSLSGEDKLGNLNLAFNVAHEHLGVSKLLDAEDIVNMPKPDERCIMTYVAQLYNVFSSLDKVEAAGRRVAKLVELAKSISELSNDYESRACSLSSSINEKISQFNNYVLPETYHPTKADILAFRQYLKNEKRQWIGEQEDLAVLYASIQAKLKTHNRPPYVPPESAALHALDQSIEALGVAEHNHRVRLNEHLRSILDRLRQNFANPANKFGESLQQLKTALASSGSLELQAQLETLTNLQQELAALTGDLPAIKEAEDNCNDANIEDNEYTEHTFDDLEFAHTRLTKTFAKQINFIQNQIIASQAVDISPEQLEEFKESFNHFDHDKNGSLSRLEFKSALSGLGVVELDFEGGDKRFEGIFQKVAAGSDSVSFNQFVEYMVSISKDDTSEATVRHSFDVLAGGKDFITSNDLKMAQLPQAQIEYLVSVIPPYPGIEDAFNYKEWLSGNYN